MFDRILQGLHEVEGVQATLVVDGRGAILGSRAHPIYDLPLLQQVSQSIISAVDSVQLVQDDWETLTATYSDGRVLLRNLRPANRQNVTFVLAVIADIRLNPSFAGVALRVAAAKLKAELESPSASSSAGAVPAPTATIPPPGFAAALSVKSPAVSLHAPQPAPAPAASAVTMAASGLSWSGLGRSTSGASTSGVTVADEAASRCLTACTKALSNSVGPMAKVFIKDAVRKVCPDRPFTRDDASALIAELERHITDPSDLDSFYAALKS